MSNYVKLAAETTDQYLTALAEGQDNFLKSLATFPSWAPAYPTTSASASAVPTIQEMTEAGFAFAQKLLKQQQDFAAKFIAATEPAARTSPSTSKSRS